MKHLLILGFSILAMNTLTLERSLAGSSADSKVNIVKKINPLRDDELLKTLDILKLNSYSSADLFTNLQLSHGGKNSLLVAGQYLSENYRSNSLSKSTKKLLATLALWNDFERTLSARKIGTLSKNLPIFREEPFSNIAQETGMTKEKQFTSLVIVAEILNRNNRAPQNLGALLFHNLTNKLTKKPGVPWSKPSLLSQLRQRVLEFRKNTISWYGRPYDDEPPQEFFHAMGALIHNAVQREDYSLAESLVTNNHRHAPHGPILSQDELLKSFSNQPFFISMDSSPTLAIKIRQGLPQLISDAPTDQFVQLLNPLSMYVKDERAFRSGYDDFHRVPLPPGADYETAEFSLMPPGGMNTYESAPLKNLIQDRFETIFREGSKLIDNDRLIGDPPLELAMIRLREIAQISDHPLAAVARKAAAQAQDSSGSLDRFFRMNP